jgi:Na+-driven multidrug efflux pump
VCSSDLARGDLKWVKNTLVKSIFFNLILIGFPCLILILFGNTIIQIWTQTKIIISFTLFLGLGLWTIISSVGSTVAIFFNGTGILKFQAITAIFLAVFAVILKIFFVKYIGIAGIVWGTLIAYVFCTAIPTALYLRKILSNPLILFKKV